MDHSETLKNRRVIITGGSKGFGRAMVAALLARGAEVTAVDLVTTDVANVAPAYLLDGAA